MKQSAQGNKQTEQGNAFRSRRQSSTEITRICHVNGDELDEIHFFMTCYCLLAISLYGLININIIQCIKAPLTVKRTKLVSTLFM